MTLRLLGRTRSVYFFSRGYFLIVKSARAYECVPFFMTEKKVPIKFLANENNIRAALGTDAAKNEKARSERTD